MNVCIYTAATSVVFTQIMLDRSFDIKYNTKTTYTFRICLGLFIMGCTCLFIPFADSNVLQVYMRALVWRRCSNLHPAFIGTYQSMPILASQLR